MTEEARVLVRISGALATGRKDLLEAALRAALDGADPLRVEEALLQSYLFLGYPAALRGLAAWRKVSGRPAPAARRDEDEWESRGAATCGRVYAGQYGRLRANIAALHPDMERWMITEGYGKVIGRPGLDLATRGLGIVALLAPQDAAPQLYSHLRGSLNAGASAQDVQQTVAVLEPLLGQERAAALRRQWDAVSSRRSGEDD
jgi:4-carboxymuconolactone decarboxylase